MDLYRLRALVTAPMASLFLVLSLCAFVMHRPVSVGMYVPMARVRTVPFDDCQGVDRSIVVLLHKDGSTWLNETQMRPDGLRSELAEIYDNRKYKLIYMFSDPDVSFGEFANFYNNVASSTRDLRIGLRTRQLETQLQQCPPGSSCGLDWPDHTYTPCVGRRIQLLPVRIPRHGLR